MKCDERFENYKCKVSDGSLLYCTSFQCTHPSISFSMYMIIDIIIAYLFSTFCWIYLHVAIIIFTFIDKCYENYNEYFPWMNYDRYGNMMPIFFLFTWFLLSLYYLNIIIFFFVFHFFSKTQTEPTSANAPNLGINSQYTSISNKPWGQTCWSSLFLSHYKENHTLRRNKNSSKTWRKISFTKRKLLNVSWSMQQLKFTMPNLF